MPDWHGSSAGRRRQKWPAAVVAAGAAASAATAGPALIHAELQTLVAEARNRYQRRSQRSGPGTGPSTARKFVSWARY